MVTVADTSWLQAFFDVDDAHHAQALREARTAAGCVVPMEILTEFLALRRHRAKASGDGSRAARSALEGLLAAGFVLRATAPDDGLLALYRERPGLTFPDCVAVWVATGGRLLSFDAAQLRAWKKQPAR